MGEYSQLETVNWLTTVRAIVAQGEYGAAEKYKHIIDDFPEVVEVMNDEVHHGDAVKGLL